MEDILRIILYIRFSLFPVIFYRFALFQSVSFCVRMSWNRSFCLGAFAAWCNFRCGYICISRLIYTLVHDYFSAALPTLTQITQMT